MSDVLARLAPALEDRYRIEREIGAGGMATVYLAHDLKHDREVAIKILRPELAAVLGAERFLNEIRITARLDHPHILTLIDSGAVEGLVYYVLPFVRGESLRDRLRQEKQLGVDDAISITKQIGSALDYAHRQGVFHRDVKPENILIHEGEAVLTDFGIALAVTQAGGNRLTESGLSLGTPQYMSPEQATGDRALDARGDEYSLAAVLYEMLAGEPPHTGPNIQAIIAKLLTQRPVRLRTLRATIPESVDFAVDKALAKLPADRFKTVSDFVRAVSTGEGLRIRPRERRKWVVGAGVLASAAALALAVRFAPRHGPQELLPPIDRVQLTTSGNAELPSISPDGTRIAFVEHLCEANLSCDSQLVIQDVDGTSRLVAVSKIPASTPIISAQWTRDGRFLVYTAGSAQVAVSTLGGSPRQPDCCLMGILSGDTVLMGSRKPGDSIAWLRRVSLANGQSGDSVPLSNVFSTPGMGVFIVTGQIKDRLLLQVGGLDFKTTDLRLIDYNGKIIDRRSGADLGRDLSRAKWVKKKGMLLVAVRRVSPSREFDLLGLRVNSSTIQPQVDTVLHRVELGGSGEFDISDDGGRMVFVSGPTEETVLAMNRNAQSGQFSKLRQVLASTAPVRGRISPNGDRIAIIRRVLSTQGKPSQILVTGFDSPTESTLGSPVEGLLDITWRPDGDNLVYSSQSGRASVRLTEVAVPGGQTRELGNVDGARGWNFAALRDSGFALIGADDRSVVLTARPGKKDIVFHGPAWITQILSLTPSPDGGFLAASALSRDTLAIAKINLRTGAFTRVGGMPFVGGAVSAITWLADGTIIQPVANDGGLAVYRVPSAGGPVRKQTSLQNVADIASSVDGSRAVAFTTRVRTDIYMIRNFGAFLER